MKKVLFHEGIFSSGGTTKALLDYAINNEKILGNKSFLAFKKIEETLNRKKLEAKIKNLSDSFEIFFYNDYSELQSFISSNKIEYFYTIKSGEPDGVIFKNVKNLVHAVFPQNIKNIHGDVYAYVSEWLSRNCEGNLKYVPHIVEYNKKTNKKDFRKLLNIPKKSKIFSRIGSYNEFNIPFVYQAISDVLNLDDNIYFMFCNTKPFIEHERVFYIDSIFDEDEKFCFIDDSDCMIHARMRGETFGISIAEYSIRGKPIFTFNGSNERSHIDILKEKAYLYHDKDELISKILSFSKDDNIDYNCYREFSSEKIMKIFNENFLQ